MTKVRTSELIGPALDWAVARAEGADCIDFDNPDEPWIVRGGISSQRLSEFSPSTNWHQGGSIIEREGMTVGRQIDPTQWAAEVFDARGTTTFVGYGPTPLIAAIRCYCCAKLGDQVEIPEELD